MIDLRSHRRLIALFALVVWLSLPTLAHAAETNPLSWSAPEEIDHANNALMTGVACPSSTFCAAVDDAGDVMTTTDPAGGAAAWHTEAVTEAEGIGVGGFDSLSCPSGSLCVATTYDGDIFVSTTPADGEAWTEIDPSELPNAPAGGFPGEFRVSCASADLCVAVSGEDVVTSTDPTGGPHAWTLTIGVDPGSYFTDVSCTSASFCAAIDGNGNVLTTSDPTGGADAWAATQLSGTAVLWSISCGSDALCVVTDDEGDVFSSTEPTGGASRWHKLEKLAVYSTYDESFAAASCTAAGFCLLTENGGENIFTSADPTGEASAWQRTELEPTSLTSAACTEGDLCVIGNSWGNYDHSGVLVTTDPTGGPSAWHQTSLTTQGHNEIMAMSCASTELCVLADDASQILTSTDPTGGVGAWKLSPLNSDDGAGGTTNSIDVMACPSSRLCVAGDVTGDILTSTDPEAGGSGWTSTTDYRTARSPRGISCPTTTLCVMVGEGYVETSTDPAGGSGAWLVSNVETPASYGEGLTSVSCPSESLCVATDSSGNVLTSTDPTGGVGAWNTADVDGTHRIISVSCASVSFCVADDSDGAILSSDDPTGGPHAWQAHTTVEGFYGTLDCSSTSLCVAAGYTNDATGCSSQTFTEAGVPWTLTTDCAGGGIFSPDGVLTCPSAVLCLASDYAGLLVGTPGSDEEPKGGKEPPAGEEPSKQPSGGSQPSQNPTTDSTDNTSESGSTNPGTVTVNKSNTHKPVSSKTQTRAQKLAKALKACRKLKKAKRAKCEKAARKRYQPKKKSKEKAR